MPTIKPDPGTVLITRSVKLSATNGAAKMDSKRKVEKKDGPIPTSADVTGIELRLLPPYIIDNRTEKIWPFPGYARLYCLVIVVSDVENQVAGNIDLKGFQRIGDREHLPINKTIFYWQGTGGGEKAPSQIHVMCQVMKSKKDLRNVGEILTKVKSDEGYKSLVGSLKSLASDASKINMVTGIISEVAGIVGKYLKDVEDKPLGAVINSYTTLHGDFDKLGVTVLKYPTRNVDFSFDIVVRSAKAESTLTTGTIPKAAAKKASPNKKDQQEKVIVDMTTL